MVLLHLIEIDGDIEWFGEVSEILLVLLLVSLILGDVTGDFLVPVNLSVIILRHQSQLG